MKKALSSTLLLSLLLLSGCGSSDSDSSDTGDSGGASGSINFWDYLVSSTSSVLTFDYIATENSAIDSTEIGSYTHEYTVVNENQVKGSYRNYEGEYLFENGNYISYGPSDTNISGSYSSGSLISKVNVGSYVYASAGTSGWSNSSGGTTFSVTTSGKDCIVSKLYDSITLYDGYTYTDVLELTCETELDQTYTPQTIVGNDKYKEYYQKNVGWIGKVNENCIVAIADNDYEFIDDDNTTCVKTRTQYELYNNQ